MLENFVINLLKIMWEHMKKLEILLAIKGDDLQWFIKLSIFYRKLKINSHILIQKQYSKLMLLEI